MHHFGTEDPFTYLFLQYFEEKMNSHVLLAIDESSLFCVAIFHLLSFFNFMVKRYYSGPFYVILRQMWFLYHFPSDQLSLVGYLCSPPNLSMLLFFCFSACLPSIWSLMASFPSVQCDLKDYFIRTIVRVSFFTWTYF